MKTRKQKKGREGEKGAIVRGKEDRLMEEGKVEWERGEWRVEKGGEECMNEWREYIGDEG